MGTWWQYLVGNRLDCAIDFKKSSNHRTLIILNDKCAQSARKHTNDRDIYIFVNYIVTAYCLHQQKTVIQDLHLFFNEFVCFVMSKRV